MSDKIMSDFELQLLRVRLTKNPITLVDPAVAARLLSTAEHYRNCFDMLKFGYGQDKRLATRVTA